MEKTKIRNIDEIEVFCKVAQWLSFTKAAEDLRVPVSVVSKRLSKLEETLSVSLIQRSTRTMRLTDEGEKLLPQLQRLLSDILDLEEYVVQKGKLKGLIKMTLPVPLAKRAMANILSDFLKKHPEVEISLNFSDKIENLIEGGYDLAIRFAPPVESNLIMKRLGANVLKFVCSPEYAKLKGLPRTVNELKNHNLLILPAHRQRKFLNSKISLGEIANSSNTHTNSGQFVVELAKSGIGIAVRSHWDVQEEIRKQELLDIQLDDIIEGVDAYLVTPANRYRSARVRLLMEAIMDAFPDYLEIK